MIDKLPPLKSIKKIKVFPLEKIALSINCGYLIPSIRDKYIDPKIRRRKDISPSLNNHSKKIRDNSDEDKYSPEKIKYQKYHKLYKYKSLSHLIKKSKSNSIFFSSFTPNNFSNTSRKIEFLTTSGMINGKKLNEYKETKRTISSLLNINNDINSDTLKNYYAKLDDMNKINNKYNLNLNIPLSNKEANKIVTPNSGTLMRLLKHYTPAAKNDNSNFFLTKLTRNDDVNDIIMRQHTIIGNIKNNNSKTFEENKKVVFNNLHSRFNEVTIDRLLEFKNIKSVYEMNKMRSYKRFKNFEKNVNNLFSKKIKGYSFSFVDKN